MNFWTVCGIGPHHCEEFGQLLISTGEELEQLVINTLKLFFNPHRKKTNKLNAKIAAAGNVFGVLNQKFIGQDKVSKRTNSKSTYVPFLAHASESFAYCKEYHTKMDGKTHIDRIRNEFIRGS